jgi:hypothetical protein
MIRRDERPLTGHPDHPQQRTMESADILHGVTMQEAGVSKVISVAIS